INRPTSLPFGTVAASPSWPLMPKLPDRQSRESRLPPFALRHGLQVLCSNAVTLEARKAGV
ncbi:MAG: hypothetical protein MUF25_27865, partial [Pirellulaceae bacterium]|nr:hypothetical protein [Pirellulaceae bacterium]